MHLVLTAAVTATGLKIAFDQPNTINNNCIFFQNFTFTCRENCDSTSFEQIEHEVAGFSKYYYYRYNCSTELDEKPGTWGFDDGMLESMLNR